MYFRDSKQLVRWHGGRLDPVAYDVAGEVLSIRSVNGAPQFAVRRLDGIRIIGDGNVVIDSLPASARRVLLLGTALIYSTREDVVVRRADASERRFSIRAAEPLFAMSADYVEVRSDGAVYALRITPGREELFVIPEPAP